jgi:hypothetical protein
MTMTLIADAPVDLDAEGFMTNPEQWNGVIAEEIAHANGIPELTDRTGWSCASCASGSSRRAPHRRSVRSARSPVSP